ncbi:hypothetical protein ACJMK2_037133, partial [Sinanodonta woodiana]
KNLILCDTGRSPPSASDPNFGKLPAPVRKLYLALSPLLRLSTAKDSHLPGSSSFERFIGAQPDSSLLFLPHSEVV